MKRNIYYALLFATLIVGCSKVEPSSSEQSGVPIVFGDASNGWTKGSVIEEENFTTMEAYGFLTDEVVWDDVTSSDQISSFMSNQEITRADASSPWSYSPLKYWPLDPARMISFIGFAPSNVIIRSAENQDDGKPKFYYSSSSDSKDNYDILWAPIVKDRSSDNSDVSFAFTHAMTRLQISAKLADESSDNESFSVNGVTFYGIYGVAFVEFDQDGKPYWTLVDDVAKMNITATQGYTLKSYDDLKLTTESQVVNEDGNGIFVLPQEIESVIGDVPTVRMRVRHNYFEDVDGVLVEKEDIWSTADVSIPTPAEAGWCEGQFINMEFTFDINSDANYLPMTVHAEIYEWQDVEVEVEIPQNLSIYCDKEEVSVDDPTVTIFTNYEGDVTFTIDGSDVDAVKDGTNYNLSLGDVVQGQTVVVKATISANGKTVTKVFNIDVI